MPPAPAADALAPTGEVAPGVHVLEIGAFTVFAVEFRDFIVAVEAPENHPSLETIPGSRDTTRLTAAFVRALRAVAPGKPVRYAILSHHHSDHLGGARTFAEAGVTLIVAPGHREAARRAAGSRATIDTVAGRRTISDGTRALEIVHVDRNPHTEECLFVWLPAERIVFQGDLFYFDRDDTFPPPGREAINRFFARWLDSHGFKPRAVYGVHGSGAATERELEAMRR
jgi:glyoxylase-like metal-dependent hydrolase (beta-lactamase superfamily II)